MNVHNPGITTPTQSRYVKVVKYQMNVRFALSRYINNVLISPTKHECPDSRLSDAYRSRVCQAHVIST